MNNDDYYKDQDKDYQILKIYIEDYSVPLLKHIIEEDSQNLGHETHIDMVSQIIAITYGWC